MRNGAFLPDPEVISIALAHMAVLVARRTDKEMSAYVPACETCAVWRYDINKGVKLTYRSAHMVKAQSGLPLQSCQAIF